MNGRASPAGLHVWLDPSCPWAWQTFLWLRDLEAQGEVRLSYGLFSLEVNATERPSTFPEAATRYGDALAALTAVSGGRTRSRPSTRHWVSDSTSKDARSTRPWCAMRSTERASSSS